MQMSCRIHIEQVIGNLKIKYCILQIAIPVHYYNEGDNELTVIDNYI